AWLDRVRPGLALYVNAVRVTAKLVDVRESNGPIGYTGFRARRHGVILVGYSNGLRKGPASVNGIRTTLREIGMQSAFVDLTDVRARVGDEVVLLGDESPARVVADGWQSSCQEVLCHLCAAGLKQYGN